MCRGGDVGAPLKGRSEPPVPLSGGSPFLASPPARHHGPQFLPLRAAAGHSAAALTPPSFPSGSKAPGVEIQTFRAPETSVSGSLDPLWGFHAKRAFLGYFLDF